MTMQNSSKQDRASQVATIRFEALINQAQPYIDPKNAFLMLALIAALKLKGVKVDELKTPEDILNSFHSHYLIQKNISLNINSNDNQELSFFLKSIYDFIEQIEVEKLRGELCVLYDHFCKTADHKYMPVFCLPDGVLKLAYQHFSLGEPLLLSSNASLLSKDLLNLPNGSDINCQSPQFELLLSAVLEKNYNIFYDHDVVANTTQSNLFLSPPFKYKIDSSLTSKFFDSMVPKDHTEHQIAQFISSLKPLKKAVVVVPDSFLSATSKNSKILRKILVERGILEAVIHLPPSLFSNTSINTSLLFLQESCNDEVLFVNARNTYTPLTKTHNLLDSDAVVSMLNKEEESDNSVRVKRAEVENLEYLLQYAFYKPSPEGGTKLLNILATQNLYSPSLQEVYRKVSIQDLKGHKTLKAQTFDDAKLLDIDEREVSQYKFYSCPTLFVSTVYNKGLNMAYYIPKEGEVIAIQNNSIMAFKIGVSNILPLWLLQALAQSKIVKRLEEIALGSAMKRVSERHFLNSVQIVVPDLKQQQEEQLKEAKQKILQKHFDETELRELALGDTLRLKKHLLTQYCAGLHNNIDPLLKRSASTSTIQTKERFYPDEDWTFHNRLEAIKELSTQLGSLVKNLLMTELIYTEQDYKLITKLPKLCQDLTQVNAIDVSFDVDSPSFNSLDKEVFLSSYLEEDAVEHVSSILEYEPVIKISEENLREVLQNFVANAKRAEASKVKLQLSLIEDISERYYAAQLNISNNGQPLPPDFTLERFYTKGDSLSYSSGLGGHHVKTVLDEFKGQLSFQENPSSDFPVSFILRFPITELSPLPCNA